jgi:hypothetical protein
MASPWAQGFGRRSRGQLDKHGSASGTGPLQRAIDGVEGREVG